MKFIAMAFLMSESKKPANMSLGWFFVGTRQF